VVSFAAIVGLTSRVFVANMGRQASLFVGQPPDDCGPLQVRVTFPRTFIQVLEEMESELIEACG